MRLEGKRIVIFAGASGIGGGSTLACATEGAEVISDDACASGPASLAGEKNPAISTHVLDMALAEGGVTI